MHDRRARKSWRRGKGGRQRQEGSCLLKEPTQAACTHKTQFLPMVGGGETELMIVLRRKVGTNYWSQDPEYVSNHRAIL